MTLSTETRLADLERANKNAWTRIVRLEDTVLKLQARVNALMAGASAESITQADTPKRTAKPVSTESTDTEANGVGYYYSDTLNKALYIDKHGKFWRIQADGKRGEKPIKPVDMETYTHIGVIAGPAVLAKKLREGGATTPVVHAAPKANKPAKGKANYDDLSANQLRELIDARKGNVEKIVAGTWARGRAIAMRQWLMRYDAKAAGNGGGKSERAVRSMG